VSASTKKHLSDRKNDRKNKKQRTKLFETSGMVNLAAATIWDVCPSAGCC